MNISIRKLFVLLAVVLSLVAVQAVWAKDCNNTVSGTVIEIAADSGVITVETADGSIVVYGVPVDWGIVELEDNVVINAYLTNNDKLVACYLTVDDGDLIELRPRTPVQLIGQSVTVSDDTDCTCDNCYCNCPGDCLDCPCDCSCDCTCDGTGPNGPKGPKK